MQVCVVANDPIVVLPQASIIDAWNSAGLPEVLSGMFVSSGVFLAFLICERRHADRKGQSTN